MNSPSYDVIIAGAGFAGMTLATAIASDTIKVLLLEAKPYSPHSSDNRASSLSASSVQLLKNLNLFPSDLACPIQSISVRLASPSEPFPLQPTLSFHPENTPHDAFSYTLENNLLRKYITHHVLQNPHIHLLTDSPLTSLTPSHDTIHATIKNGRTFSASLMVGADGAFSSVRKLSHLSTPPSPYHHTAISCHVSHTHPHLQKADQIHTPHGTLAFLPLTLSRSHVIISYRDDIASSLLSLSPHDFTQYLSSSTQGRLGTLSLASDPSSHPLSRLIVPTPYAHRTVLVADAAHVIHPLAGQNLNLGLRDVATLADHITSLHSQKLDIASSLNLYHQKRKPDVQALSSFTHFIHTLFEHPHLSLLAPLAFRTTQHINPLKSFFVRTATDAPVNLPPLMQHPKPPSLSC